MLDVMAVIEVDNFIVILRVVVINYQGTSRGPLNCVSYPSLLHKRLKGTLHHEFALKMNGFRQILLAPLRREKPKAHDMYNFRIH